jgi:hypothetical protein
VALWASTSGAMLTPALPLPIVAALQGFPLGAALLRFLLASMLPKHRGPGPRTTHSPQNCSAGFLFASHQRFALIVTAVQSE